MQTVDRLRTAVLFLLFNRPDTAARVFSAIRAARPPRLYVAADGPRTDRPSDVEQCTRAREIATSVDWDCTVITLFRDNNLGCKHAVSGALSWFFEQEEQGIILEDDCLPSQSFFRFCEELLERYRHDERVMSIGGSNFQNGIKRGPASYFASKHFHCWGWASWRRAWNEYEGDVQCVGLTLDAGLEKIRDGSSAFPYYWRQIRRDCRSNRFSSWAYPMTLTCFARIGAGLETLHLAPQVNLVANLGFAPDGTHVDAQNDNPAKCAYDLDFPLIHPEKIVRDKDADRLTDLVAFHVGWLPIIKDRLVVTFPQLHATYRRLRFGR